MPAKSKITSQKEMDSNKCVMNRFKKDLAAAGLEPEELILFGSRARGDNLKNSDYDVVVISEKFEGVKFPRRLMQIEEAWMGTEPIEPLAYTPEEYVQMGKKSYVVAAAQREGVAY